MTTPHPAPLGGNDMPRFGGPATMMRLPPDAPPEPDVAFIGVPLDIGTSNRPGARFGPRDVRAQSCLLRPYQMATGAAPFDDLVVADLGDVPINTFSLTASIDAIRDFYADRIPAATIPLSIGGDHTITYPILQALAARHGPVGLVHVDAHADVNDTMFGERVTHGTWLRRAIEEDLVDPARTVQIGLRGSGYSAQDFDWIAGLGALVVPAEECWHVSLAPLMASVRERLGPGPAYLSFDIDGLDPSVAPGTGTPEIAGLTGIQGVEIIRGCRGLDLVGADVVEVAPAYDPSGNTSLLAANLLFEQLCVLPGVAADGPDPGGRGSA
ncbi:MAG TPA: agmatinase [Aquihabitans sp.]|nr:agmatinase [Aquihabitans sp.]